MANPKTWPGVTVKMQSALATAVTLTGITKANPGVASWSAGTDPANGDYLLYTSVGMRQVDQRVIRAANLNGAGNTVELEGVDTTLYDTFVSGSFQVITFGTTLGLFLDVAANGGDFGFIDYTTISDTQRRNLPDIPNPINYQFRAIFDPADAGYIALKAASDNQARRAFSFQFKDNSRFLFNGYVGFNGAPKGTKLVECDCVVTVDGLIQNYAT